MKIGDQWAFERATVVDLFRMAGVVVPLPKA